MRRLMIASALGVLLVAPAAAEGPPEGFREWTHVKSMVIVTGHPLAEAFGGMHHVYVNDVGLSAMRAGGPFPDGSILVFDLFESTEQDHAYSAGARKVTAVMEKAAEKFPNTGGWDFRAYKGGSGPNIVKDAASECFGCHAPQKDSDFVFSKFVE